MVPLKVIVVSLLGLGPNAGAGLEGVVLDFTASWCGPCQQMSPIVSRLERQGLPIRKVDADSNRELVSRFRVDRYPTFILVIEGVEQKRIHGAVSESDLRQLCARVPRRAEATAPVKEESNDRSRNAAGRSDEPAALKALAVSDRPGPSKPGFKWPFSREAEEQPPARDAREGAVPRAKYGDLPAPRRPVQGNPLAASVRIRVKDAQGENFGSGTVIDSRIGATTIVTCGHIFRDWNKQSIIQVDYFTDGGVETVVGRRVYHNLEDDVGLIAVNVEPLLPSCRVASPAMKILKGLPVTTVGCSGGDKPTVQSLKVTALNRYLGADNIEVGGIPAQGRSGGGLFTKEGELIGVCSGADSHYREGLYIGLRTVQAMLGRCQLTHLYRTAGEASAEFAQEFAAEEPDRDESIEPTAGRKAATRLTALTEPEGRPLRRGVAGADGADDGALREALEQAGAAEIVCIIRPINQPRAASRVVILNRASRRFVDYLSDEMESQPDIRETTLTAKVRSPRPADPVHNVGRPPLAAPAEGRLGAPDKLKDNLSRPAGPQPYRRHRPARPLASVATSH